MRSRSDPFVYTSGSRKSNIRLHYDRWRKTQGLPQRCDIANCQNHGTNQHCGKPLRFELDHINGCNSDNRLKNLRLLCPNCHSQQATRGGANRGRVEKSSGGFATVFPGGGKHYTLPAEAAHFQITWPTGSAK